MAQKTSHTLRESGLGIPRSGVVLLVDEDREDLHYYGVILQEYGYRVRGSESYEEGTRLVGSEPFDFIIVSQGGPNFEGRCVLERAIQMDDRPPVLVVARCLDMQCYLEAMQLGAVDYLAEPVNMQELGRAVETHIHSAAA
jgi:DNA-binding response OmpR family regulator